MRQLLGAVAVLGTALVLASPGRGAEAPKPLEVGDKLTPFSFPDTRGKLVKSTDFAGKVLVIQITTHWCGHCRAEAPLVEKEVWRKYRKKGVQVLGISYAHRGDPVEKTKEYREQTKLTYPVLVDAKNQSEPLFGVRVVPTNIVVGKDGVIRYKVSGLKQDGLIPAVEAALAAK